jgi:transcriptional regulator of arginine metabolism
VANKHERHAAILELVKSRPVGSQEELRRLLLSRGWAVTQSTLSRDLRELRLARVPTPEGVRYEAPGGGAATHEARALLEGLLPQLLVSVDGVSELLVLHTVPGGAQPVSEAIDRRDWTDVLGTIGGENTVLIVCRSAAARERLARQLREMARKKGAEHSGRPG